MTMRFSGYCSVGEECPHIDAGREGWLDVTGYLPGTKTEATVEIPQQLAPGIADLTIPNLGAWVAAHHVTDLLRVQTLPQYGVPSDGDDFHRYAAGDPYPVGGAREDWFQKLRDDACEGRIRRVVHVVREPLSPYLRYQFEWGYTGWVAAGHHIRIASLGDSRSAEHWPASHRWWLHVGDFTVAEGKDVARLRYDSDGAFVGAVQASGDSADVYAALAETIWDQAVDFTTWWGEHRQYHRATRAA